MLYPKLPVIQNRILNKTPYSIQSIILCQTDLLQFTVGHQLIVLSQLGFVWDFLIIVEARVFGSGSFEIPLAGIDGIFGAFRLRRRYRR